VVRYEPKRSSRTLAKGIRIDRKVNSQLQCSINGPRGILLHKRIKPTDIIISPDEMKESEKLLGLVKDANVSTIICNMCVD